MELHRRITCRSVLKVAGVQKRECIQIVIIPCTITRAVYKVVLRSMEVEICDGGLVLREDGGEFAVYTSTMKVVNIL